MNLYGYPEASTQEQPSVLTEAALAATAAELRRIAAFFVHCADEMERMGDAFDHLHLGDFDREFENGAQLVVARRQAPQVEEESGGAALKEGGGPPTA